MDFLWISSIIMQRASLPEKKMNGTDISKAVGLHVAKLSDQPYASSTPDEQNDVAVQEVEKSDNCIMIHDDDLVVDLQDEPVEGIRKLL